VNQTNHVKGKKSTFREYTEAILIALILAFFIRSFIVQAFKIPSGSMIPTLLVGDHILVNKFIFGPEIPFTSYRLFTFEKPKRREVVVFLEPTERKKDFIKRVIGLPGDTVEIDRGVVYVNGAALNEPYLSPRKDLGSYGPYVVPAGNLFVLGDNRTDSDDSRGSLRYIPIGKVVGRAFAIIWPPGRWTWLSGVDYGTIPTPTSSVAKAPSPAG
jgi:signal peptidase I